MQDVLLLAAAAVIFGGGYWVMKRLDRGLKTAWEARNAPEENALRIGLSDPLVTQAVTEALERFSRQYPGAAVCLYAGGKEQLLAALGERRLDIAFLPGPAELPAEDMRAELFRLPQEALPVPGAAVPLLPLQPGCVPQTALWRVSALTLAFVECLRESSGKKAGNMV